MQAGTLTSVNSRSIPAKDCWYSYYPSTPTVPNALCPWTMFVHIPLGFFIAILALAAAAGDWQIDAEDKATAFERTRLAFAKEGAKKQPKEQWGREWFEDFKKVHKKTYRDSCSEARAFKAFQTNMQSVHRINEDKSLTWWAAPNKFFDMSAEDFKAQYLMKRDQVNAPLLAVSMSDDNGNVTEPEVVKKQLKSRKLMEASSTSTDLPSSVNWLAAGKMTEVKNQRGCGSSWASAAVSALEAAYLIHKDKTSSKLFGFVLSEQQLMDCSHAQFHGYGCNGGSVSGAFEYVYNHNLTLETEYPNIHQDGYPCRHRNNRKWLTVQSHGRPGLVHPFSRKAMMQAVARQPVVSYFSVQNDFFLYAGGVYHSNNCNYQTNHAMTVIGYSWSDKAAERYWIMQNSWSASWGDAGLVRVAMSEDGMGLCNMYTMSSYPSLDFGKTVRQSLVTKS